MMTLLETKKKFIHELKETYSLSEIDLAIQSLAEKHLHPHSENIPLDVSRQEIFEDALRRLKKNEPLEYIIGEVRFFQRVFKVNSSVHVPRPETETMVQWILEDFNYREAAIDVLDIGTGAGVLPITLKKEMPNMSATGLDISEEALEVAEENASRLHAKVEFLNADVFEMEMLPRKFDIIASNPPYILKNSQRDVQRKFLAHEPPVALYVEDSDPMVFNRKIAQLASGNLKENGAVYLEINQFLEKETSQVFADLGFKTICRTDVFGNPRTLKGFKS